jgi:hypothetical protein
MAEILEIAAAETEKLWSNRYRESHFRDSNRWSGDYFHNKRADNRRTNKFNERTKNKPYSTQSAKLFTYTRSKNQ